MIPKLPILAFTRGQHVTAVVTLYRRILQKVNLIPKLSFFKKITPVLCNDRRTVTVKVEIFIFH